MATCRFVNDLWDDAKAASLAPVGAAWSTAQISWAAIRITHTGGGNTAPVAGGIL